jgi:hypothetical protein
VAKKFLVDIDLSTNELQNAVIQNLPVASEPTGIKGRLYFDETNNILKVYNGSLWQSLATGGSTVDTLVLNGDVTGSATAIGSTITVSTTIAANSVALGTDTTGNYVADVTASNYLILTGSSGEGWTPVLSVDATTASTASKVVARDSSGDVYARTFIGNLTGLASNATQSASATIANTALHANTASAIDWSGVTSKPDPVVTVVLSGDVTGNANATLTDLGNASVSISTTIAANSVELGTDTTGNYVANVTASTGVSITGAAGEGWTPVIAIGQPVGTADSVSFSAVTTTGDIAVNGGDLTTTNATGALFNTNAVTVNIGGAASAISIGSASGNTTVNNNLVVSGNLTVSGSVTTLNTESLVVEDNLIVLNSNVTGTPTTDAGIEIERGTSLNVSVLWNEGSDSWTVTNDGTNYHAIGRKYSAAITGNSSSASFNIDHNLATRDVTVNVYEDGNSYDTVEVDITRPTTNRVTIGFATAPTTGTNYRVVIVG